MNENEIEEREAETAEEPKYAYRWRYDEQRAHDEQKRRKTERRGAIVFACVMATAFLVALGVLVGTLAFRKEASVQPSSEAEPAQTRPMIGIVGGTIAKNEEFSYLGMTFQSPADGVLVMMVNEGSGADGVLNVGDVITAIDGRPVTSIEGLIEELSGYKAGNTVTLRIYKLGNTQPTDVMVKLGAAN